MKNVGLILAAAFLASLTLTGCSKPAPAPVEVDTFAEMVYADPDSPEVVDSVFALIHSPETDSLFVGDYLYGVIRNVIRQGHTEQIAVWHYANALIEADYHRHLKSAYWCIERARAANTDSVLALRIDATHARIDSIISQARNSGSISIHH